MKAQLFVVASVTLATFLVTAYLMLKPDYLSDYRNYWRIKDEAVQNSFKRLALNPTGDLIIVKAKQRSIVKLALPSNEYPSNEIVFMNPKGDYYEYFVTDKFLFLGNLSCIKVVPLFNHTSYKLIYGSNYVANLSDNALNVTVNDGSLALNVSVTQVLTNFSGPVIKGNADVVFLPDAIIVENESLTLEVKATSYTNGSNWILFENPRIGLAFDHEYSINNTGSYYIVNMTNGSLLRIFPGKLSFDYDYDGGSVIRITSETKGRSIEEFVGQEDWEFNYSYRTPLMLVGKSLLPLLIPINKTAINMSATFSLIGNKTLILLPFVNKEMIYIYYNESGLPATTPSDIIYENETGNVYFENSFYRWNISKKELYIDGKQVLRGDVIVCINGSCQNLSEMYFEEVQPAYAKIGPLLLLAKYPGIMLDERNCEKIEIKFPINFSKDDFIALNAKGKDIWIKSCDHAEVGDWFNVSIACNGEPSFIVFGTKEFVDEACASHYRYYLHLYGTEIQTLAGRITLFG